MRILNIISSLDPYYGGPIEGALRLADIWQAQGHAPAFATLDAPDAPYLAQVGAPVAALGHLGSPALGERSRRFPARFGYSAAMVPWLRAHAADHDAIIVHGLWNYATLAARRALVGGPVPYFVFPHGALDPWFKREYPKKSLLKALLWPLSEGVLLNNAAGVLFTTEEEQRLTEGAYRPYRVRPAVVGFGSSDVGGDAAAQTAAFRAAVPALGARPFLLFLSRLHAKKGCDLLIHAFANIAAAHPELDLVMAGPDQSGWQAELEGIARVRGVAERVHWAGMIEGDLKWGAFRACEAFALTSHSENFGIVVAEALACSRPVLISDKVNLWREVAAAGAGLVEPDTQDGSDRLLGRFLALSDAEKAAMAANARACFERHFRMESAAANVVELMRSRGAAG
jgi:glycosyltransferase involved in cell wall biosynthesis